MMPASTRKALWTRSVVKPVFLTFRPAWVEIYQMRSFPAVLCFCFMALLSCRKDHKVHQAELGNQADSTASHFPNLVYQWADIALQATAHDTERFKPRPTVTSRYLGLVFVSIFDAWSRYHDTATPIYLANIERRPSTENTLRNKEIAVSYAAYRTLCEYYFSDTLMFREMMVRLGLDPSDTSTDPGSPAGIGNLAAQSVIEARRHDGSNQYGDEKGSDGTSYFDYSHYTPVNTANQLRDINRWQPIYFIDANGKKYAPGCLTPFWGKVKPVALTSSDQFRSTPPPLVGSKKLEAEVKEVVDLQKNLTDSQKALVEFMRDGPASVQQAGHWLRFAMQVSSRDRHALDQDVQMFLLTQVTAMDAFIACWDTKMTYDFARPLALVHHYYRGKKIKGWAGPQKGLVDMDGKDWRPYSPDAFLTPPFPGYVSGHSTVSGGCAEVLRLYTGKDEFGQEVKWVPGQLTEPNYEADTVVLEMPTFTETAEMAGLSRVLGGYHISSDNLEGLALGRKIGEEVFHWYLRHMGKTE